jgi:cation:H+ antiporter
MFDILILIAGLAITIGAATLLVDGASCLARALHVSDLAIGLTIVAFGTSAPELTVSVIAALSGNTTLALGNVLGSNIANILLILGCAAVICPLAIQKSTQWKEIPFALMAVVAAAICAHDIFIDGAAGNCISRVDGLMLLLFFTIFLYYSYRLAQRGESAQPEGCVRRMRTWVAIVWIILGLGGLFLGGKLLVTSAVCVALRFGMSESMTGLTIVAVGTSLPEMATSIVAAIKKNPDIAVGNVVGSNIFNIFFILGTTAIIRPVPMAPMSTVDLAVATMATVLLFLSAFTFRKKKIDRVEGALFLALYAGYLAYLIATQTH